MWRERMVWTCAVVWWTRSRAGFGHGRRRLGFRLRRRPDSFGDRLASAHLASAHLASAMAREWREAGSLDPGRQGKPARSTLDAREGFIPGLVEDGGDIALYEMAAKLAGERGVRVLPGEGLALFLQARTDGVVAEPAL